VIAVGAVLRGQNDSYRIDAEHARGGFGVTYRGRRERDGSDVIVKVLRLDRMGDWKVLELFERESKVLRQLSHPGIPAFVDSFAVEEVDTPQAFVLVQELVRGRTLRELMRSQHVLGQAEMLAWFGEILEILAYLHALNPPVVHRDVTPKNIILREDGTAVLVDFGSVQATLRTGQSVSSTAAGTFGYAPMEQFVGRAVPSSDLYGLAMTFLAVASGREPENLPMDGVRVNVRNVVLRDARFDAGMVRLLTQMTEPDPRRRLPDAVTALEQLAVLRGQVSASETRTPPSSPTQRLVGAARVTDPESYLVLISSRLTREGFSVRQGGKLGDVPLLLQAEKSGGTLRSADSFHLYVACADQLEGQPGPEDPLSAEQLIAFTRAAVVPHAAVPTAISKLIAGRTIVAPIVVTQGGTLPGLVGATAARTVADDGVTAVPVVVDLEQPAVHVVPEAGTLGDDAEGVLPYLWWLASPRVIDRPKGRAKRSPLKRIIAGVLAGMLLLVGTGLAYLAAAPSGQNYLVYVADPDARRMALKRFYTGKALLGTDLVTAVPGQVPHKASSLPSNAYLCSLSGNQVAYLIQDKAADSVTYWKVGEDGKARHQVGRTPYSWWWSCALHGDRLAFATGSPSQDGRVMLQEAGARVEAATGSIAGDKFPAWFPDGRRLAVAAGASGQERLVQIDLQTGERTRLTDEPDSTRGAETRPAISPDGRLMAFYRTGRQSFGDGVRRRGNDVYDLYVLDLGARKSKLLVQEVCFASPASWLSDDELVYGKWLDGECAVFFYDLKSDVASRLPVDF
jgi:serine/threonine protein kinase